jgi:hypothetical protein
VPPTATQLKLGESYSALLGASLPNAQKKEEVVAARARRQPPPGTLVALAITFITAVSQREPPLNPVMMLWVNLIMDTMGALALGTEEPREDQLLARMTHHAKSSLISRKMWRNIFTQSSFQLAVLLILLYSGESIFGFDSATEGIARIDRGGAALPSEEQQEPLSSPSDTASLRAG